ncbi:MAG: rod-binding protein [Calditerrivibrio sp.]|nr:rod-binding protein [Calditerrivibrio sp.]
MNSVMNIANKNFLNLNREEQLKKACEDFEALFYEMVLKSARATVPNDGIIKRSFGEEIFREMLDGEFAKGMAKSSKGGLKELLFDQLKHTLPKNYNSSDGVKNSHNLLA